MEAQSARSFFIIKQPETGNLKLETCYSKLETLFSKLFWDTEDIKQAQSTQIFLL